MRIIKCPKCSKEGQILTRVHNDSTYQYTYEECKNCRHQVLMNKKPLPSGFKEEEIRRKAGKRKC